MEHVNRYGIMRGKVLSPNNYKVDQWVEKPSPDLAPSQLAIAARYVFTPEIFKCLEHTKEGLNNEVQLTDAMMKLLDSQTMYGLQFDGKRFDVGNQLDFIKTNIHFGMKHPAFGPELRNWLTQYFS